MAIIFKDAINVTGNSTFSSSVTVSNTLTADTVVAQGTLTATGDVDFTEASVEGLSSGDVGLSGGIGSGKTTVSNLFEQYGISECINAACVESIANLWMVHGNFKCTASFRSELCIHAAYGYTA